MLLRLGGMQKMKNEEHQSDNKEAEYAAFGPDAAAGEPARALHRGVRKASFCKVAAVRNGEKESLAPIEAAMQSDGKPKSSGATQRQTEKHRDHKNTRGADYTLSRIEQVRPPKEQRKNYCSGPKRHAGSQSVLCIAAEAVLLKNPHEKESEEIQQSLVDHFWAGKRDGAERIAMKCSDQSDHRGARECRLPCLYQFRRPNRAEIRLLPLSNRSVRESTRVFRQSE